jgi:hypothetical protein
MLFSFELLRVECERVLSTEDSAWGEEDGIRVFFIVLTTGGFHQVLVSGREYPPPDAVDNWSFVPGKAFSLDQFPPQNAENWTLTPPNGVSDIDSVMITVLGVNEGLAYVAGGGGLGGSQKANLKVFEEIASKGSEKAGEELLGKAGEPIGGAAFGAAWSLIEGLIEELNKSPECRGVAFCYPIEISMRKLLLDHLSVTGTTHHVDGSSPATGLGLVAAAQHPAGCGSPQYAVDLGISRIDALGLSVDDVAGAPREGEHVVRPVAADDDCRPRDGEDMHTWLTYVDRTITIVPSHYYESLKPTWHVNGTALQRDDETLTMTLPVSDHLGGQESEREVSVRCEQIKRDGKTVLVLHTRGEDGNYRLEVSLKMNFEGVHPPPPEPWVEFRSEIVWVEGSELEGDDAWREHLQCRMDKQLKAATAKKFPVEDGPVKPKPAEIAVLRHEVQIAVLAELFGDG